MILDKILLKFNLQKIKIYTTMLLFYFLFCSVILAEEISENQKKILIEEYGYTLEAAPFEVRNDFFKQHKKSWRKITYGERVEFFMKWLNAHPEYDKHKKDEGKGGKNPALNEKYGKDLSQAPFDTRLKYFKEHKKSWKNASYKEKKDFLKKTQNKKNKSTSKGKNLQTVKLTPNEINEEYGEYLNNAPFDARRQYFEKYKKSWKNVSYEEKKDFLKNWLVQNKKHKPEVDQIVISEEIKSILDKVHREYGKDLYSAPFDVRVDYYQAYNTSWYDINYNERKIFLIDWYKNHQEKIDKLRQEMKEELSRNLETKLDSLRFIDVEIPEIYGDKLQDVPFELKQKHYEERGTSWTSLNYEIRELYTKKWLLEHKTLLDHEKSRIKEVKEHKVKRYESQKRNQADHAKYNKELDERRRKREERDRKKMKAEMKRRKAFKERTKKYQKKLKDKMRSR